MTATKDTISEETMRLRRMLLNSVGNAGKADILEELDNTLIMLETVEANTITINPNMKKIQFFKDAPLDIYSEKEKAKAITPLLLGEKKIVDFDAINVTIKQYGIRYAQNENTDGQLLPPRFYPIDTSLVTRGRKGLTRKGSSLDGYVQDTETKYQLFSGLEYPVLVVVSAVLKKDKRYYQFDGKVWKLLNVVEYRKVRKAMQGSKLQYIRDCAEVEKILTS